MTWSIALPVIGEGVAKASPSFASTLRTVGIWVGLWLAPLLVIVLALGWSSSLGTLWVFFSQMAMVTFGGAYAVLAYVAQEAVVNFGWLRPGEMVDGLALAETTPGPLSFVGFLAAADSELGGGGVEYVAVVCLFRLKLGITWTLAVCGGLGFAAMLIPLPL